MEQIPRIDSGNFKPPGKTAVDGWNLVHEHSEHGEQEQARASQYNDAFPHAQKCTRVG
jgi:hypothetical protein